MMLSDGKSMIEIDYGIGHDIVKNHTWKDLKLEAMRLGIPTDGKKVDVGKRIIEQYRFLSNAKYSQMSRSNTNQALGVETPAPSTSNSPTNEVDIMASIREFLARDDRDFRCDVALNFLPQIIAAGVELSYPIGDEVVGKILYSIAQNPSYNKLDEYLVQIGSDRWLEVLHENDSHRSKLLDVIRQVLAPDCQSIAAHFDRLYIEKEHIRNYDMFRECSVGDKSCFGSLIIFLPSLYKGSELVVTNGLTSQNYSFGFSGEYETLKCHAVAFFRNQGHFKKITEGCNVFLHYWLTFKGKNVPRPLSAASDYPREQEIRDLFERLFSMPTWPYGKHAAVILERDYPINCESILLKGSDRTVFNGLSNSKRFEVQIAPVEIYGSGMMPYVPNQTAEGYYRQGLSNRSQENFSIMIKKIEDNGTIFGFKEYMCLIHASFRYPNPGYNINDGPEVVFLNDFSRLPYWSTGTSVCGELSRYDPNICDKQRFSYSFKKIALFVEATNPAALV